MFTNNGIDTRVCPNCYTEIYIDSYCSNDSTEGGADGRLSLHRAFTCGTRYYLYEDTEELLPELQNKIRHSYTFNGVGCQYEKL